MGEQSSARHEGDRYQHLFSWYELLSMLDPNSPYDHAFIEHPEAGAADDLTLHTKPGSGKPDKYIQIKWHVDHRAHYSFDKLIEVTSGVRSLLQKLFDAWKKLRGRGDMEIWLVSNWSADTDLGQHIDARGDALDASFFAGGGRALRAGRTKWQQHLGATLTDFDAFCRTLRFRFGFESIDRLNAPLGDRAHRHGIRSDENARRVAMDLIREWIEIGGDAKRITADSLRAALKKNDLFAPPANEPVASLAVHGWAKAPVGQPTHEIDWTSHFSKQPFRLPPPDEWPALLAELRAMEQRIAPSGSFVEVRGAMALSVALALGSVFSQGKQYRLRVPQNTSGQLADWVSSAEPSDRRLEITHHEAHPDGDDLALGIAITADVKPQLSRFLASRPTPFRAVVIVAPDGGPGPRALHSDRDAVALAMQVKERLRSLRAEHHLPPRTHIFLASPVAFAVFLGQALNAVGEVLSYERTPDESYQLTATLPTA